MTRPLVEELPGGPSPWEAARRLADRPHLLLLDSARADGRLGVYSFVSADPLAWLTHGRHEPGDAFARLRELWSRRRAETVPGLPPFQGGVAGLLGYDLCHHVERLPRPRFDEFATPDLAVGLYDWVLAHDHAARRSWLVVHGAAERLRQVKGWLAGPPVTPPSPGGTRVEPALFRPLAGWPGVGSNMTRPEFEAVIARGIGYVHAGDCFQVNLSQRLLAPLTVPPLEVYARLRERNPAPFAGYLDVGGYAIASASPERFVQVRDGEVVTRPIKGTRPRGATPAEDEALKAELLASAKDRAENVMIVDLLRNDLGRVCAYGTVRPTEVCRLETYPFVHHLVSEVRGVLRPDRDAIDLLRAAFPGGSVTGAPKVRAMEIIAELEPTTRGPYCGCLGYLGFDGATDTNLLIRTLTLGGGWMQFPVGGGVVADSSPRAEYDETLTKARGLLRVLEA